MMRVFLAAVAAVCLVSFGAAGSADAGGRHHARSAAADGGAHAQSRYYRRGPQVRGYVKRRGGYSYTKEDTINTYGDSRGRFGAANSLRDPSLDTQTRAGPFDHGFFFNTPMGRNGGDSPYMN